MFWKTWPVAVKGASPTQFAPSLPMAQMPAVLRSGIQVAMTWQPMPAKARLPSGTRVELLCGQPEQKERVPRAGGGGAGWGGAEVGVGGGGGGGGGLGVGQPP